MEQDQHSMNLDTKRGSLLLGHCPVLIWAGSAWCRFPKIMCLFSGDFAALALCLPQALACASWDNTVPDDRWISVLNYQRDRCELRQAVGIVLVR